MTQPDLFARAPVFDSGVALTKADQVRLGAQILRVRDVMRDGQWRTVQQIAALTHDPEPSISAQLRNLRKPKHGGYTVLRRRIDTHYEYRLVE